MAEATSERGKLSPPATAPGRPAPERVRHEPVPGRPGIRIAAVVLAAAFIALLAYGLLARSSGGIDAQLERGQAPTAPEFDLAVLVTGNRELLPPNARRALADGRLALRELRGTPVVLNFWASWCPPCRGEAPTLERAWRRAARDDVLVLGLNMQDVRGDARAFVRDLGLSYPSVREPDNEVARSYGVTGLPETFFIDRRGRIVGHVIGEIRAAQLARGIAAARRGEPVGSRRGGARRPTR